MCLGMLKRKYKNPFEFYITSVIMIDIFKVIGALGIVLISIGIITKKRKIHPGDLPIFPPGEICISSDRTIEGVEKTHINRVLHENGWNISKTARELGIDRSTLYGKIKRYGIKKL